MTPRNLRALKWAGTKSSTQFERIVDGTVEGYFH